MFAVIKGAHVGRISALKTAYEGAYVISIAVHG